jgi:hypothetical protein
MVTLRPFKQSRQALEEAVDDLVLAVLAHREVDVVTAEVSMPNSEACSTVRRTWAVSKNSLAGTQPAVQAGSADLVALDDGDVEPRGGSVECGGVASGASSDHDDIELLDLVCTAFPFSLVRANPRGSLMF